MVYTDKYIPIFKDNDDILSLPFFRNANILVLIYWYIWIIYTDIYSYTNISYVLIYTDKYIRGQSLKVRGQRSTIVTNIYWYIYKLGRVGASWSKLGQVGASRGQVAPSWEPKNL